MAQYVPPYADYRELRDKFIDLADDYLLLYAMEGVKNYEDFLWWPIDPLVFDSRRTEALQTAEDLLVMVKHIDVLAQYSAAALGAEWPNLVAILERVGPHDSFKPLWVVAKAWGVDIGESEARVKRGAPIGPRDFQDKQSFLLSVKAAMEAAEVRDKGVTRNSTGATWLTRLGREGRDEGHSNPGQALMRAARSFGIHRWKELKEEATQA